MNLLLGLEKMVHKCFVSFAYRKFFAGGVCRTDVQLSGKEWFIQRECKVY